MSTVVSFRLDEIEVERLRRAARAMGRSPGEVAAVLVDEGLRLREFPGIEFRDTPVGRQAFLRGTRLGVWQVAELVEAYATTEATTGATIAAAAEHLGIAHALVGLTTAYARAFPAEIAAATADARALNERLLATGER